MLFPLNDEETKRMKERSHKALFIMIFGLGILFAFGAAVSFTQPETVTAPDKSVQVDPHNPLAPSNNAANRYTIQKMNPSR